MAWFSRKAERIEAGLPLDGIDEIVFCVFDEKYRLQHHFTSGHAQEPGPFSLLAQPERTFDHQILRAAVASRGPVSMVVSHGEDRRLGLHILPFERKPGKWFFACFQVGGTAGVQEEEIRLSVESLMPGRLCLLLVDGQHRIRSVGACIPEAFGYERKSLLGMSLGDLFPGINLGTLSSFPMNTNQVALNCLLVCSDGARREVQIRQYSAPQGLVLYALSDTTPKLVVEDPAQVASRERRRIGQDIHDSIGQMLTGISLLSRSLGNGLTRSGLMAEASDAAQISALADEASNQIRQISRDLMPTEIVTKGLFDSLRELARITTVTCGMRCVAHIDDEVEFSDGAEETHLYRIAQEAVNNAVRHSGGSKVEIVLARAGGGYRLEVVDDGTWKDNAGNLTGIGLKTMEYRATAIGARLMVGGDPRGGSRMSCILDEEAG